jgi:hypothetical protein
MDPARPAVLGFHDDQAGLLMGFLKDLIAYMGTRKKYWLLPVLLITALFGGLIVLTKGSAVAPFIYTLF